MGVFMSHHRVCQTVPEADLQKAFSALLVSPELGALCDKKDPNCELEKSELCSVHGAVKELLRPQNGSTVGFTQRNTLRGFLAALEWIRSHPKITRVALILLLLLLLVFVVSWAVVSGSCGEIPVTPVASDTPLLLACPHDWVGYRGICYFLSRDQLSWDQAQARCSELGASLAMPEDWEMRFLFFFSQKIDYWVGLRRRGQELQWGNGSSFSSSFPVHGNSECMYLAENHFGSLPCTNLLPFVCSKAQTRLRWDG